ncbi:MAG: hypothetical protein WA192_20180, partial [Candidatus Acidiferrales bacterium]
MDPARSAGAGARIGSGASERVKEQAADWLRYGDDLGLGPYYRDRAPSHGVPQPAAPAAPDATI